MEQWYCRALYQKFETYIPEMKLRSFNFYIHVSVSDEYIHNISPRWWEYINCSQIHECGKSESGRQNIIILFWK